MHCIEVTVQVFSNSLRQGVGLLESFFGQWIFGPNLFLLIEKLNVAKDYIDFDSQFLEN